MSGATAVMAVILLETAVGGAVALWASGTWGVVRRGFFVLTGLTVALCAIGAWATTRAAIAETTRMVDAGLVVGEPAIVGPAGDRALAALAVFAALSVLWQVLLIAKVARISAVAGLLATASGVAALVMVGIARGPQPLMGVAELAMGAAFLGSTLLGLYLGHWYLVERKLAKDHMVRAAWFYIGGVAAAVIGIALSAQNPVPEAGSVSPLLAVDGFTTLLGGGLIGICALIAGFAWKLSTEGGRSIQAATGMFYLAVIMAFSAELAVKTRFFPVELVEPVARLGG